MHYTQSAASPPPRSASPASSVVAAAPWSALLLAHGEDGAGVRARHADADAAIQAVTRHGHLGS